jgi:cytoskeletal protein RodZ
MQTIGQRLKAAREEKNLSLEKVFKPPHSRQLSAGAGGGRSFVMSSPVQARGYLRNYAEFLELDLDRMLEDMRAFPQNAGEIIGPADSNSSAWSNYHYLFQKKRNRLLHCLRLTRPGNRTSAPR